MSFQWFANISANTTELQNVLLIEGVAVELDIPNSNKWALPKEEALKMVDKFKGIQVRKDHNKSIDSIVGKVVYAQYDSIKNVINFKAEVSDKNLIDKIVRGYVNSVSIGADSNGPIQCSVCGKNNKPIRTCKCENSHSIVRNVIPREISFVADPAYENTKIYPVGFVASLQSLLNKMEHPQKYVECSSDSCVDHKICELIHEFNPGTRWTASSLNNEYPEFFEQIKTQTKEVIENMTEKIEPLTLDAISKLMDEKLSKKFDFVAKKEDTKVSESGEDVAEKAVNALGERVKKELGDGLDNTYQKFISLFKEKWDHVDKRLIDLERDLKDVHEGIAKIPAAKYEEKKEEARKMSEEETKKQEAKKKDDEKVPEDEDVDWKHKYEDLLKKRFEEETGKRKETKKEDDEEDVKKKEAKKKMYEAGAKVDTSEDDTLAKGVTASVTEPYAWVAEIMQVARKNSIV